MNSKTSSLQQLKSFLLLPTLLLLPLLVPNVANAAVQIKDTNYQIPNNAYFVSPNGKNNNSGKSPQSPLPVERAIAVAPRGATIVFRGGTYRNVDTKITKKLTLQAYPREKPLLKGSVVVQGWIADGSTWRKDGWNYSFPKNMGQEFIDPKYPLAGHRDMVYVNGVSLKQVGSKANVGPGKFYVDGRSNKLYIGSNPAGKTVESTTKEMAFGLVSNRQVSASGTKIRGLGFAHYAEDAIEVMKTDNVTLENNTFVWNGLRGASFRESTDAIIRGNIFSYNGMHGVRAGKSSRFLVEGNTFSYNSVERFRKNYTAAGMKIATTNNTVWRNNLFEHNFGSGMWLDVSSINATIQNNTIRHNETIGIMFELSHKANIAGNTISNNAAGVMIADSSNTRVVGNRFFRNKKDILLKDSPRRNRNRAEIAKGAAWVTRNNNVQNNRMSR